MMGVGIRPKLLAAFAAVALFTGVLGWYAVAAMERLDREQRALYGDIYGGTHLLATWIDDTWESRSDLLSYLLVDDPTERSRLRARMLDLDGAVGDLVVQMDAVDSDRQDVDTLDALSRAWQRYTAWREHAIIDAVESGDRTAALSAYAADGEAQNQAINTAIDAFLTRKQLVGTDLQAAGTSTYAETRTAASWLTASAMALAVLIGLIVSRRVAAQARLAEDRGTRVRAVMDSVADGILTLDDNGVIESINPAGEQIFGCEASDIIGKNIDRLVPGALRTDATSGQARTTDPTDARLTIGDRRETAAVDCDGSPLSVELTLSEARMDRRGLHIAVVRDITARKRADQRRGVQYAVGWALAGARTLDVAISGILHAIAEGFDWQLGIFWTVDRSRDVLCCHAIWRARHVDAEDFATACRQTTVKLGVGLPGRAWQSRQPVSISDLPEQSPHTDRLQAAARAGLHGAFAFPIESGGEVLGVVELFSNEVRPADLDLIMTVTAIGQQIAQFIERDRAEQAVHQSAAHMQAILEGALDCVVSIDQDGTITDFNAAAEQTFGYARAEVLHKNVADVLVPPSFRKAHRRGLANTIATGDGPMLNRRVELSALRADGVEFPIEISVTPIPTGGRAQFTAFLRDITSRREAELEIRTLNASLEQRVRERTGQLEEALTERKWAADKLEELRRRNELILTSAGEGIYGVECNGQATFVNPAAAALTGYEVSQLLERSLHEVLRHSAPDGEAYPPADCPLCAVLRDGSIRTGDAVFRRLDGSTFPVSYTSTPIWENEAIVGAVVTFQDVTERRAMDKLKDEFVSMVSHEIRTPMNGVLGMVELLLDTPLDARQREYADTARRSGETLLAIVNDILDSAKIEAGKLELEVSDLDVRAVAEDVVGLFAAQAQSKGLEIVCLVHRDVPRGLLGDAGRLRQVLLNLVGNAVKFTERGEVVVRARVATRSRDATFIRFEVTDTGPGITPDAAQRIFQPFSQADPSTTRKYGGTGLGLTISKRLVELMGGQIGVETKPGQGSTFWFNARLARQRFPVVPPPAQLRRLRVLAVDDNAATRAVLEEHLMAWGVHMRGVDDQAAALEALRVAADAGRPFNVMILDRHLADIEGLELAREVRSDARLAPTQLVLLSPLIEDPLPPDAGAVGIAAWLTKPLRQSQLYDTLVSIANGTTAATAGAPATDQDVGSAAETITAIEPGRPRVLVVEDTPINQQVARGMLARLGYSADLASNGEEALDALGRGSYAAILMDCHMPRMDGFESSREIRRREGASRHTPIIAMTASAMRGERERCLAAGMDDYIAKPVRLQELRARLQRWSGPPAEVDPHVLLGLRAYRIPGEPDPVTRLIDLFLRDAPARVGRIRAALQAQDAEAVREVAHALKGSAGTLGAHKMEELCADLEDQGASGSLEGASTVVEALEAALARARAELEALRRTDTDEVA
jgi:two-component system, sensor histidine kinase and response regulator